MLDVLIRLNISIPSQAASKISHEHDIISHEHDIISHEHDIISHEHVISCSVCHMTDCCCVFITIMCVSFVFHLQ